MKTIESHLRAMRLQAREGRDLARELGEHDFYMRFNQWAQETDDLLGVLGERRGASPASPMVSGGGR